MNVVRVLSELVLLAVLVFIAARAIDGLLTRWDRRRATRVMRPLFEAMGKDELSGFEIERRMEARNPATFREGKGTVLPILLRLTDLKLLSRRVVDDVKKKQKRFLYRVTRRGQTSSHKAIYNGQQRGI